MYTCLFLLNEMGSSAERKKKKKSISAVRGDRPRDRKRCLMSFPFCLSVQLIDGVNEFFVPFRTNLQCQRATRSREREGTIRFPSEERQEAIVL